MPLTTRFLEGDDDAVGQELDDGQVGVGAAGDEIEQHGNGADEGDPPGIEKPPVSLRGDGGTVTDLD
jgi:hypothetical protein